MLKNSDNQILPKVLVILGPTASGKTKLGVELAWKFNGEIISADSRQVYKGMDIGTGKDLKEYKVGKEKIPYHLIDVVSPQDEFNLALYQKLAFKAIEDILQRGKLPIIVGGTGLYLQAVVDNYNISNIKPDQARRTEMENLSISELFARIKKLKPDFAAKINNSDKNNPHRLVRYLEILAGGESTKNGRKESKYDFLILGINISDEKMRESIKKRIIDRLNNEAMLEEVKRLHQEGISYQKLISFGLEYKFLAQYLQKKIGYEEMVEKLSTATYRFAKHQKTWFRRWEKQGRRIDWLKDVKKANAILKKFLTRK